MSRFFAFFVAAAALPSMAQGERAADLYPAVPIGDAALAEMRGGFALAGGIEVAIVVQSDTSVNGVPVLRSLFVAGQGTPSLSVFARSDPASSVQVDPGTAGNVTTLSFSGKAASVGGAPQGMTELHLVPGGSPAAVADGNVRVETAGSGNQVILSQPALDVRHLAGDAYGSIVANRADGVSVDTITNINIDLKGTSPLNIGSTMFRVEALVVDAATRMGR